MGINLQTSRCKWPLLIHQGFLFAGLSEEMHGMTLWKDDFQKLFGQKGSLWKV